DALSDFTEAREKMEEMRTGSPFDGCYNVFLDIGANIGVHIRKLFEPHLYPDSQRMLHLFNQAFGSDIHVRRNTTCAFGIELNPTHTEHLKALERCYNAQGWRTHIITGHAASNSDLERVELVSDNNFAYNEWGARMG